LRKKLETAGYRVESWASAYLVPYDILSWLFLLKVNIEIPALHYCDLSIGRIFPFNRLGWNIIVRAGREG
jgi:2-polyprenyl-6-hydroxyphenyl methylase/3-demethylubiquinone-9 3-methyltransferase